MTTFRGVLDYNEEATVKGNTDWALKNGFRIDISYELLADPFYIAYMDMYSNYAISEEESLAKLTEQGNYKIIKKILAEHAEREKKERGE